MRMLKPAPALIRTTTMVAAPFRVRELNQNLGRITQNRIHVPNRKR